MSAIKPSYAGAASIPITLTSLANNACRQSTVVDNTSNLYDDALVSVTVKTAGSGLGTTPTVTVFVYAVGDGAAYPDGVAGTDGAYTLVSPTNLIFAKILNVPSASTSYVSEPFSVAALFGGSLPSKWGIVVQNTSGNALDGAVGSASYIGVGYTVA